MPLLIFQSNSYFYEGYLELTLFLKYSMVHEFVDYEKKCRVYLNTVIYLVLFFFSIQDF